MKIVHLIAPANTGGAESAVRSLAIGQRALGHDVHVATLTSRSTGAHPFVERLRGDDLSVTDIRMGRLDYLAETRAVGELLSCLGTNVLHTHVYHADTVGYVAASRMGVPQVATMHGFTGGGMRLQAYQKLDMWVLRRCAAVIGVSPNVLARGLAEGIPSTRLHEVPNGYEPIGGEPLSRSAARQALHIPDDVPAVGWIGRLSEEKGADMALEAFAQVTPRTAELRLIGDGPERVNLELLARHLRFGADRVRFASQVHDAAKLLPAFDALLLSSRTEGTPMVLLEAMAAGIPIVTFAVGGVPAMLDHHSALMVPTGDVGGLARALTFALECPMASMAHATVARRVFEERFTGDTCARRVMAIYFNVIRERFAATDVPALARRLSPLRRAASMHRSAGT